MARTFRLADFWVTANDAFNPDEQEILTNAVAKARAFSDKALLQTIHALHIETKFLSRVEAAEHLHPDFTIHVEANFRTRGAIELFQVLHRVKGLLLKLSGCLRSRDLHFRQYGLEYFEPKSSGAAPRGYVSKTFSELFQMASNSLTGGSGKCLNIDQRTYTNSNNIVLDFTRLKSYNLEEVTDTIIHESTHKFLATLDNTHDCPWKRAAEFYRQWRELRLEPLIDEAWTSLSTEEALQNAYGLTNYIHYMPDVDIAAYYETEVIANRAIGEGGNRMAFDSISNDDL